MKRRLEYPKVEQYNFDHNDDKLHNFDDNDDNRDNLMTILTIVKMMLTR